LCFELYRPSDEEVIRFLQEGRVGLQKDITMVESEWNKDP